MKIGYACINNSIGCTTNSTFRLASYSEQRFQQTVENNLNCLLKLLEWNKQNNILFFRMSSDIIPFASHSVCEFDWKNHFSQKLKEIGNFVKQNNMRISMHPDQFVLINALNQDIVQRSIAELEYHCDFLDCLGLDKTAKVQIHVGGMYGNKKSAIQRFIEQYNKLPDKIKSRLVIENDDRLFSLTDCLEINKSTGIPILFDNFHHSCLNNGEPLPQAMALAAKTWKKQDGILMCDYSSQQQGERKGKHASTLDKEDFKKYLKQCNKIDRDIMLEIKDKEKSALVAIQIARI